MTKRYQPFWSMTSLLALLGLLLAACGGGTPAPTPTPIPLQPYADTDMGFSLEYPVTWVQGMSEDGMVEFKSSADVNLDLNYTGGALIQVITLPTFFLDSTDPIEVLNLFKEDMLAGMQAEDDEARIVQDVTAVTVNGLPSAKMVAEAQQGTVQARADVYLVMGTDTAGLILVAYPASEVSTYEPLIQRVVDTFTLLPMPQ